MGPPSSSALQTACQHVSSCSCHPWAIDSVVKREYSLTLDLITSVTPPWPQLAGAVRTLTTTGVQYRHRDATIQQALAVLNRFRGSLYHEFSDFTYDDGRVELLFSITGVIAVPVHGAIYQCPVTFWLPIEFPVKPPMIFVLSSSNLIVRPGPNVEPSGKIVQLPYLTNWEKKSEGCSLTALIDDELVPIFSRRYPVMPRPAPIPPCPAGPVAQLATPSTAQSIRSTNIPLQPSPPQPPPVPPLMRSSVPTSSDGIRSTSNPVSGLSSIAAASSVDQRYVPMSPPNIGPPRPPQRPISAHGTYQPVQQQQPLHLAFLTSPPQPPTQGPKTGNFECSRALNHDVAPRALLGQGIYAVASDPSAAYDRSLSLSLSSLKAVTSFSAGENAHAAPVNRAEPESSTPRLPPSADATNARSRISNPRLEPPPTFPPDFDPGSPVNFTSSFIAKSSQSHTTSGSVNILDEEEENTLSDPCTEHATVFAQKAAPPRPPNPALLGFRNELNSRLARSAFDLHARVAQSVHQHTLLAADLALGEPAMLDEIQRLDIVNTVCKSVRDRYSKVVVEGEKRLHDYEMRGDGPEVDEIVCSSTVVHNQLLDLVTDDAALADTIYHLARGLNQDSTAKIDLDQFLKRVRALARDQFFKRATINKIVLGFGARDVSRRL